METKREETITGYPHLDRPWMKWYAGMDYNFEIPNTNIADYLRIKNRGREELIAETYYGKEITYYELFDKINAASRALTALGVRKGNNIFTLLPNIPESGQLWLGATQIGAITDFADPRPDSMDLRANSLKILELIKYEKADYIVALDICYTAMLKPIENELKELGMKNIIVVSAKDSMNIRGMIDYLSDVLRYNAIKNSRERENVQQRLSFYKALYRKIMAMSKDRKAFNEAVKSSPIEVLRFKDLVRDSQYTQFEEIKDASLVNYIGHTSGTSGARPKPITLTNANHISSSEQLFKAQANFEVGDRVLHELPFFSPLGADNNYILNLASGANNIDVPEFEINEFGFLIKKYHPNVILGTPSWISSLMQCEYLEGEDVSYIHRIIYGGDSMESKDEKLCNEWLQQHNCETVIEKGHGMSEYCGCGSYAQKEWNKYDSIGIPLPNTIYAIVDPNIEDRLVPINKTDENGFICGELVVSSDAVTPGTLKEDVIVPKYELDGRLYIRTRDLVKMDKDGIFYFESRKDRSFTRYDGYKVKPFEIEKAIEKNKHVRYCRIVQYFDSDKRGLMPIAHIVLNNEEIYQLSPEELVKQIVSECFINDPNMSTRQIPSKFKIRSTMPLTKNSKIDFNALIKEELAGDEIDVYISETNLSVENIIVKSHTNPTLSLKLKINR